MAPTEVLAEQHFLSVQSMLGSSRDPTRGASAARRPVEVALLTSRTAAPETDPGASAASPTDRWTSWSGPTPF